MAVPMPPTSRRKGRVRVYRLRVQAKGPDVHSDVEAVSTIKATIHRLEVRTLTLHAKKSCTAVAMMPCGTAVGEAHAQMGQGKLAYHHRRVWKARTVAVLLTR